MTWTSCCLDCDWTITSDAKACDLGAERHTKATKHATVQRGTP